MIDIPSIFGRLVFNEKVMKERLPKETYDSLKRTVRTSRPLELSVANVVAEAMKNWAIENGATHFTHWFHPMTGITAEKHDSFIAPAKGGRAIMEFSGKSLVRGESDASSFPSGGLRATFEARGYTAWDPTSYAFVKDGSLYIPTAFCSYDGQALDKKTPLLRSMDALDREARRILKLFGTDAIRVSSTVGPEQEYFLIDKSVVDKRSDLLNCGKTLFGARPPKGQELEDHYYGSIKPRVAEFMKELDERLWELGVYAKTKHNEVAPGQHELASIFESANIATDHNQLTMELMKSIAQKHGMICVLDEKPFAGVNGSGKHNNWSLSTETGLNLLDPGDTPESNAQFLLFLVAVIKAVDEYQGLLRAAVSSAHNDCRLGASEAPPAIVSIFLGGELSAILDSIESGSDYNKKDKEEIEIGSDVLPRFPKDSTDRNRTSPFAFTGNKFELRMLGSSFSIAGPNIVLNTIVADELRIFADELEKAKDFNAALSALIKKTLQEHKRIIFNDNNYSDEWVAEAEKRGLLNLKSTVDALPSLIEKKNVELFVRNKIFTESELNSRYEIILENYCKTIHIEALTMIDMVRKQIMPSCIAYEKELLEVAQLKSQFKEIGYGVERGLAREINELVNKLFDSVEELSKRVAVVDKKSLSAVSAKYYHDEILSEMSALRGYADALEPLVGKSYWPFPDYEDILYSVK